jgi:hypothetical protein
MTPTGPDSFDLSQPWPTEAVTDSLNTVFVTLEGVEDTTIRPVRSPILMQIRPPGHRQPEQPPPTPPSV